MCKEHENLMCQNCTDLDNEWSPLIAIFRGADTSPEKSDQNIMDFDGINLTGGNRHLIEEHRVHQGEDVAKLAPGRGIKRLELKINVKLKVLKQQ